MDGELLIQHFPIPHPKGDGELLTRRKDMKEKWALGRVVLWLVAVGVFCCASPGMAADCRHDPIVRDWIIERDQSEQRLLREWAKNAPTDKLASDVGIIVSSELFIASKCRSESFLKQNLHFLGAGSDDLRVETLPCMILERVLGKDILSPHKNLSNKGGLR
jgi:hypothetical protein